MTPPESIEPGPVGARPAPRWLRQDGYLVLYRCPECGDSHPVRADNTFRCHPCRLRFRIDWDGDLTGDPPSWQDRSTLIRLAEDA